MGTNQPIHMTTPVWRSKLSGERVPGNDTTVCDFTWEFGALLYNWHETGQTQARRSDVSHLDRALAMAG